MYDKIRVFVIDDSAFMRQVITKMLEKERYIEVIGRARNGREALERIPKLRPNVVTMDVEMPVMDGLETLKELMEVYPVPVVMVSSLTHEGTKTAIKAVELGAVDFVAKPDKRENFEKLAEELPGKLKLAATVKVAAKKSPELSRGAEVEEKKPAPLSPAAIDTVSADVVIVGTSTGGPSALQNVIPHLPKNFPVGVVVIQHMPKGFTKALADRLNNNSRLFVKEAENGDTVKPGTVLVAPAGSQLYFERKFGAVKVALKSEASVPTLFKPSVDVTLLSASEVFGGRVLSVIMTGMGNDGVRGLKEIKKLGGKAFAEAEETCVVYGMPKSAVKAGLVDEVQPVQNLAERIVEVVKNK